MSELRSPMKSEHYIEQAVVQLLSLKLRAGTTRAQLRQFVAKCLEQASRSTTTIPNQRGLDIHRLGSVLRSWHKEAKYLTPDGLPRPLKADGRLGLKTLVRRFYHDVDYETVFERLVETRLICRADRDTWIPTGRTARIPQLSHETLEHLSEGVVRYVETVTGNVTAGQEEDVLFERSCKVTKLPTNEFGAFRDYVSQQALAFLTAVDDWLESRNVRGKSGGKSVSTAGVYTFAYMERRGLRGPKR
jgi:hypothetical protein